MKKAINLTIALLLIAGFSVFGQDLKTEKFKIYGDCDMCKERIEKAVTGLEGISEAEWDKETKMIEVSFDESKVKLDDIHKAVADVGHDTDKVKADDEVYGALPEGCHYERESKPEPSDD